MSKETVIREFGDFVIPNAEIFDIADMKINRCTGCWSCWVITPGRCVFKELDNYYHAYITSDKVTFFLKPKCNFVGLKFKMLMDRMCPLFMPYIQFADGGSWHMKRYEHYPDIAVYYEDTFDTEEDRKNFCDYVRWVFVQFHSKNVEIKPVSEFAEVKCQ